MSVKFFKSPNLAGFGTARTKTACATIKRARAAWTAKGAAEDSGNPLPRALLAKHRLRANDAKSIRGPVSARMKD